MTSTTTSPPALPPSFLLGVFILTTCCFSLANSHSFINYGSNFSIYGSNFSNHGSNFSNHGSNFQLLAAAGGSCVKSAGECEWDCVSPSGESGRLVLAGIGNRAYPPRWHNRPSQSDARLYSYNPCYPFTEKGDAYTLMNTCEQVVICQKIVDSMSPQNTYWSGGLQTLISVEYEGEELVVKYKGDVAGVRNSKVYIRCTTDVDVSLEIRGQIENNPYEFVLSGFEVCLKAVESHQDGLSTGSIMVITYV